MASPFSKLFANASVAVDHRFGWDKLPKPLGIVTLIGLRTKLRERNLYDTGRGETPDPKPDDGRHLTARTIDGTYNDLDSPTMGAIGARFGRNVPLEKTYAEPNDSILEPNPRTVSRELLTRDEFKPASIVNLLAGAWLQFEVHDWFSHGKNEDASPWLVELADDDDWYERPMRIPRTRVDPSHHDDGSPPTYVTADSHWWDASQIYGSDSGFAQYIRAHEDGKLRLDPDGQLPRDLEDVVDLAGVAGNFWLGLGLLHTLFTHEHNAICDRLRKAHATWSDDRLYETARLVNAAVMAKIHTVEWTPALISHPTTAYAMQANWHGILGKHLGRFTKNEVLGGIPGSATNHHGVPYSLTEEFVAVYRMHPLLPDDFTFRSLADDRVLRELTFPEIGATQTRDRLEEIGLADAFYSFGRSNPGAITLHNYPRFLQTLERADGETLDLAALDVLRIRERGVPRYNEFRRLFHLKPARTFDELTPNPTWAEELRRVYGDVERVDLMIGLYSEPLPKGFGFSDTAFRVFILMASRRLKSDRFFTRDYNAKTYTQEGLDCIVFPSLIGVLLRHVPELAPALDGVTNGFAPWKQVGA